MHDIDIQKIEDAYYRENIAWERNIFAPRTFDGVMFFVDGLIEFSFTDKTIIVQKGDLLFLPGNIPYSGKRKSYTATYYVINFTCSSPNAFAELIAPSVFTPKASSMIRMAFLEAIHLWEKHSIGSNFKLKSFIYSIIFDVFNEQSTDKFNTTLFEEIQKYICDNLNAPDLRVSNLCKKFYISDSQLRRIFFKATSMTPNEYISTLRIDKAKSELSYTKKTIKQISADCGFSSQYYFSRCFYSSTNMSPTEYRKKHYFT